MLRGRFVLRRSASKLHASCVARPHLAGLLYVLEIYSTTLRDPTGWALTSPSTTRNVYDLGLDKSVDATDTPNSLVLSYVYEIPVGRGRQFGSGMNGVMNAIVGGWQTTGIATLKQGFPLGISSPGNGLNYFGAGQNVNVTGDVHVSNPSYHPMV